MHECVRRGRGQRNDGLSHITQYFVCVCDLLMTTLIGGCVDVTFWCVNVCIKTEQDQAEEIRILREKLREADDVINKRIRHIDMLASFYYY